jgi:hypothetical protein
MAKLISLVRGSGEPSQWASPNFAFNDFLCLLAISFFVVTLRLLR